VNVNVPVADVTIFVNMVHDGGAIVADHCTTKRALAGAVQVRARSD
jgi:hypothetical protein